jgi:penicillin-binding protein 2
MSKKIDKYTLNPDEIFADAQNIPGFDKYQFEGRLEKPITKSTFIGLGICLFLLGGLIFGKTLYLQIIKGGTYALRSENNYLRAVNIFPARGNIYDRNGKELAWNDFLEEDLKPVRGYIDMPGLAHVLGYVGVGVGGKIIGKDGIEKKYEDVLAGKTGVKLVEMNSKNETVSESVVNLPENGKSIKLTIDADLQSAFYSILENVITERGFGGGAGVILDVHSGQILALTSWPEYNSQILSRGELAGNIKGYLSNPYKPFLNRAISGLYAPGSIIKPIIALAALAEKVISPDKQILSTGSISLPNPFFPDKKNIFYDWRPNGWVDIKRALAVSCNIYFYAVGGGYEDVKGLGISKIDKYASLFGLGAKTNVDLDKEEDGLVPSPALKTLSDLNDPIWRIGDTYNVSIGQGDFQITPLQAAIYAAAIANNGHLLQPYLVNLDSDFDYNNEDIPRGEKTIDIPLEYFQIVKEGMRMAVLEGTAQGLSGLSLDIGAKTGTAELESEANKFVNSWLIAFLPYENPRIALSIVLEKGRASNLIGGVYVGRQLLEWMFIHTPEYLTSER